MAKIKHYSWVLLETKEFGITKSWDECKDKTFGRSSVLKSFSREDDAIIWVNEQLEILNKE